MKKKVLSMLLVMAMTISLAACGGSSNSEAAKSEPETSVVEASSTVADSEEASSEDTSEEGGYKIGILPQTMNDVFQVILANAAKSYLEDKGCEATIMAGTTFSDTASQMEYLETMAANGYDAVIISPVEGSAGICKLIGDLVDQGIVVVNVDNRFSDDVLEECGLSRDSFPRIGTAQYDAGKLAGEYVKDNYEEGVKVGIIAGTDGTEACYLRTTGFTDACEDVIDLVATQNADWEVEKAYTATQNMLTAHPDIEVLFCECDALALGTANAVADMGIKGVDIIGYDGTVDGIQAVIDGKFVVEIAQDVVGMAEDGAQLALDMLGGAKGESKDIPPFYITADNAEESMERVQKFATNTAN